MAQNFGVNTNLNQALAQQTGYTGDFGGGAFQNWLSGQGANVQSVAQNVQAGQFPTSPGATGYQPQVNPDAGMYPQFNSGVQDIFAEPLHQYEMSGLSALGQGNGMASQAGMAAMQMLNSNGQFSQYLQQGAAPITQDQINGYMNPYQDQVMDRVSQGIQDNADRARAKLNASVPGSRSFGNSSQAIQLSELQKNAMNTEADQMASLGYQGYGSALGAAQADRSAAMGAAQATGNQASGLSALANQFSGIDNTQAQNQLAAGQYIRNFNQSLADRSQQQFNRYIGYDDQRIGNMGTYLGQINGGTGYQHYSTPSTLSQVGAGLSGLGSFANSYNQSQYDNGNYQGTYNPNNTYYSYDPTRQLPWG